MSMLKKIIRFINFKLTFLYFRTLIHEMGHVLAYKIIADNQNGGIIIIKLDSSGGGSTHLRRLVNHHHNEYVLIDCPLSKNKMTFITMGGYIFDELFSILTNYLIYKYFSRRAPFNYIIKTLFYIQNTVGFIRDIRSYYVSINNKHWSNSDFSRLNRKGFVTRFLNFIILHTFFSLHILTISNDIRLI
jgi:hypothetical protein